VKLSWQPPADLGGRGDIQYRLECPDCEEDVAYTPRQSGFNSTVLVTLTLGSMAQHFNVVHIFMVITW